MQHSIGILFAALFTLNAATSARAEETAASQPAPAVSVTITSPAKDERVGDEGIAEGTCSPSNVDHIWVFVQPQYSPEWVYPQSTNGAHLICSNGRWEVHVSFGGRRQAFRVTVYVGTPEVSKEIERFLAKHSKKSRYPGMALPRGLEEKAHVWVFKK